MGKNKRHSIRQTDISNFNILLVTSLLEKQNLFFTTANVPLDSVLFYNRYSLRYSMGWHAFKTEEGDRKSKVREGKKRETVFLLKSAPDFWHGFMSKCKEGSPCVYFRL